MRIPLLVLAAVLAFAGVVWVGYGVMIGLGTMGSGADASNRVLAAAIPGCGVLWLMAAVLAVIGFRARS